MYINQLANRFISHPKKLFIVDGVGAIVSMFLLGVVLVRMEWFFGIPANALYFLASLPVLFALYDLYCYTKVHTNIGTFLKAIALVNILYCILSLGFSFYHIDSVTAMGWIDIIVEIIIVLLVALIELNVANKLN